MDRKDPDRSQTSIPDWSLREALLAAAHAWHIVLIFGVVGALVGALLSLIWPSPYEAVTALYVGISPCCTTEANKTSDQFKPPITNVDDFKNWQMESLNAIIFMDPVSDETLGNLKQSDPYWENVRTDDLKKWLSIYWRNAGKWQLIATHPDPLRASQAVQAWEAVAIHHLTSAVDASARKTVIEMELQSAMDAYNQAQSSADQDQLESMQGRLDELSREFSALVDQSMGLSSNIVIRKLSDQPPELSVVRPTGQLILVSSGIGLIAWGFVVLLKITKGSSS